MSQDRNTLGRHGSSLVGVATKDRLVGVANKRSICDRLVGVVHARLGGTYSNVFRV